MIRLFHVSDVHFGAEDPAALSWFEDCVTSEKPDAILMTGDLTMRARPSEFESGRAWLQSLGRPVSVEIGNHDIPYYWDPVRRLLAPFRRYARLEAAVEQPLHLPGMSIVPLKTVARAQLRIDWSRGRVSADALDRTLAMIDDVPKGNVIFVTSHHPLVDTGLVEGVRTTNGAAALAALARAGVHAALSGHVHDPFDVPWERDGWTIRLIGAGTLSKRIRSSPPAFNEIRVVDDTFETLVRTMSPAPKLPISPTVEAGKAA